MSLNSRAISAIGYFLVATGVIVGVLGTVKIGALVVALGTVGVSIARPSTGKVERYMPIALALALLAMAIALP